MKKLHKRVQKANNMIDLKSEFILEAMSEVQETNRFLDAKAGVIVSFESTLLFVLVTTIFDSQKFEGVKQSVLSMPLWNSLLIIIYCAIYLSILLSHIIYTIRVFYPSKNPEEYVILDGHKPKGLFFLNKSRSNGKVSPSLKDYMTQFNKMKDEDIHKELVYELMKMSYIRDVKSERIQRSLNILKYLISGVVIFGVILVFSY